MPKSHEAPGPKIPPNASPNTQTTSPHPVAARPASRDHRPRGASRSGAPIPSWSHTAEAAAWTGWSVQTFTPTFTTCWTQPGDELAVGWTTLDGRPSGIADWSWSRPSSIHSSPNPIRSDPAGHGLGSQAPWARLGRDVTRRHRSPVLGGAQDVPHHRQQRHDQTDEQHLVEEGGVERRHDHGVPGLKVRSHPRHCVLPMPRRPRRGSLAVGRIIAETRPPTHATVNGRTREPVLFSLFRRPEPATEPGRAGARAGVPGWLSRRCRHPR